MYYLKNSLNKLGLKATQALAFVFNSIIGFRMFTEKCGESERSDPTF